MTRVSLKNEKYFGITNLGTQPTVRGHEVVCETNIFDFSGDLYGQNAKVEFLKFIRPETKFSSIDELTNQVHKDIKMSKKFISDFETQKLESSN